MPGVFPMDPFPEANPRISGEPFGYKAPDNPKRELGILWRMVHSGWRWCDLTLKSLFKIWHTTRKGPVSRELMLSARCRCHRIQKGEVTAQITRKCMGYSLFDRTYFMHPHNGTVDKNEVWNSFYRKGQSTSRRLLASIKFQDSRWD